MTTAALKKKIKSLVDQKSDAQFLSHVHELLNSDGKPDTKERAMLIERIERAEADFAAGRTMSVAEARKRIKRSLQRRGSSSSRKTERA